MNNGVLNYKKYRKKRLRVYIFLKEINKGTYEAIKIKLFLNEFR